LADGPARELRLPSRRGAIPVEVAGDGSAKTGADRALPANDRASEPKVDCRARRSIGPRRRHPHRPPGQSTEAPPRTRPYIVENASCCPPLPSPGQAFSRKFSRPRRINRDDRPSGNPTRPRQWPDQGTLFRPRLPRSRTCCSTSRQWYPTSRPAGCARPRASCPR
jgi:hypothetical protein